MPGEARRDARAAPGNWAVIREDQSGIAIDAIVAVILIFGTP